MIKKIAEEQFYFLKFPLQCLDLCMATTTRQLNHRKATLSNFMSQVTVLHTVLHYYLKFITVYNHNILQDEEILASTDLSELQDPFEVNHLTENLKKKKEETTEGEEMALTTDKILMFIQVRFLLVFILCHLTMRH